MICFWDGNSMCRGGVEYAKKVDDMTRKSCYKPIKAFIYIEFLANDEDAMGNLITTNLAFRELENEAVETINVFAGLNIQSDEEKEVTDMCKAWDDHYRSGVQQGIQQGEHAKRIEAIENMILLGLTKEKILTKYSEEEYEEAEKAMLVEM